MNFLLLLMIYGAKALLLIVCVFKAISSLAIKSYEKSEKGESKIEMESSGGNLSKEKVLFISRRREKATSAFAITLDIIELWSSSSCIRGGKTFSQFDSHKKNKTFGSTNFLHETKKAFGESDWGERE
jgi:hypothetical protein